MSGLLGFGILEVVGGLVDKVAKLDFNTDKKTRGCFTRMTVFVDLDRPLVSQVLVNGELIRVEYKALPTTCFSCGKYGYLKEMCTSPATETSFETEKNSDNSESSNSTINGESSTFEPWMVVERRARQGQRDQRNQREGALEKTSLGSRFSTLNGLDNTEISAGDRDGMISNDSFAKLKGKENFDARIMGKGNAYLNIGDAGMGLSHNLNVGGPSGSKNNAGCATKLDREIQVWGLKEAGQHQKGELDLSLRSVGQVAKDLGNRQFKVGCPKGNGSGLNTDGLSMLGNVIGKNVGPRMKGNVPKLVVAKSNFNKKLGNLFKDPPQFSNVPNGPFVTTTHFNPTFEKSERMMVALDGNVLDLGKYSTIVFKENYNPNKEQTLRDSRDNFKLVGTAHVPLFESMNSLVELINAQLVTGKSKETETSEGACKSECEYNKEHKPNIA
ncbi:hypothetical protein Godav_012539 [Gossypium davidsonii]|uniref:CCHC-type domain-containing protein n=1 Tax=Gossypium davidsonii TaxID=34287 RepID=A0A7J8RDH9_GOSDV|nr:hypothetical protein [Gossypium davidsonii]